MLCTIFSVLAVFALARLFFGRFRGPGWSGPGGGWRRSRHGGHNRCGGRGCGHGRDWRDDDDGYDDEPDTSHKRGWGWGSSRGRGFSGSDMLLDMLFSRLDVRPEQESALRDAASELKDTSKDLRSEMKKTRHDLSRAMKAEEIDLDAFGEAFARQDESIEQLRKDLVGALARVHDVLDPDQRHELARLLEKGFRPGMGYA